MANDFKAPRKLTDAKLEEILDNHAMLINRLIGFARGQSRLRSRLWTRGMTLAVLYLLFRGQVDAALPAIYAALVQLSTRLSHIL